VPSPTATPLPPKVIILHTHHPSAALTVKNELFREYKNKIYELSGMKNELIRVYYEFISADGKSITHYLPGTN
jgi:hypothetical protein